MAMHIDEAWEAARAAAGEALRSPDAIERLVLLFDVYGAVRVVLWPKPAPDADRVATDLAAALKRACAPYFKDVLVADAAPEEERRIWERAWDEAQEQLDQPRLRVNDRHRNHTGWFLSAKNRIRDDAHPKVILFHSFKGGVGRTTALAGYALRRARMGERVAVVDVDLDAPGVGTLLAGEDDGMTARWGVVDWLLEEPYALPLEDYLHTALLDAPGPVDVFPAGRTDGHYVSKLSRIDLEVGRVIEQHPLARFLSRIAAERQPSVILVDGRAGLSPAAGLLLGGLAHMHVLFATPSAQGLLGLERVVDHLGRDRAALGLAQGECIVVHAMVPDNAAVAIAATDTFSAAVEDMFRVHYYAPEQTDDPGARADDDLWRLDDLQSGEAPHHPVPISYRERLAFYKRFADIASTLLTEPGHVELARRLDTRLGLPPSTPDQDE